MNDLLAVFTCHKGNGALMRHWPYFQRQEAGEYWVITTTDTRCDVPEGVAWTTIGRDSYINGSHLPRRMIDTVKFLLKEAKWDTLILAEYDTVFFNRIAVEKFSDSLAAHLAGYYPEGAFYHNPWVFNREVAELFVESGRKRLPHIHDGSREASPDVFFGMVSYDLNVPVYEGWREFSRNTISDPADLELARLCYREGYDVIHGIKTKEQLEYITNGSGV